MAGAAGEAAEVLLAVGGDRGVQAGVDEDRPGAGVADEEGGDGDFRRRLAGDQRPQQLQRLEAPPGPFHHRPRPFDVAGDQRLDDNRRPGGAPGERLVQGLRLHSDLHRE